MTVLLGFVGKLACDEIRAWLPRLADWLKTKAVRKLPQELQERYEEEWQSGLEEIPGSVSKLFFFRFASESFDPDQFPRKRSRHKQMGCIRHPPLF